eukprot:CAMPEP_0170607272 /NCGR_PEP_ID=MMETSP0224-20130122/20963_1 /TAXON_ID=285029 /ORGANISM="Togula jolla, Strain CCCM 725" /LENGTH=506 /DNA_ID=CAMNT_0010932421 /DNA_START=60 /DNA_END=1580 /DNA_ORIENTATION=+
MPSTIVAAVAVLLCVPASALIDQSERSNLRRSHSIESAPANSWPFPVPWIHNNPTQSSNREPLHNNRDVSYSVLLKVGGQSLSVIPDTGSFDLLVFSALCEYECGNKGDLYDDSKSRTYSKGTVYNQHKFGSGETMSNEAYDDILIGTNQAAHQVFWEVYDAEMPILQAGGFQGILGLGPPESSVRMAEADAESVQTQLAQLEKEGSATPEQRTIVKNFVSVAEHAKKAESLAENLALKSFSFCLGRAPGSQGYLIWQDHVETDMSLFTTVKVKGDMYWSTELRNVELGAPPSEPNGKKTPLGCSAEACSAVLDTGTSLIVAPEKAAAQVEEALEKWRQLSGDCSDLSSLPNLNFEMGGKPFTLPPEAYVGDVEGNLDSMSPFAMRYLPQLQKLRQQRMLRGNESAPGGVCVPLLMVTNIPSPEGPVWIMGMPFFREYYSMFQLDQTKSGRPTAESMSFSPATSDCWPTPRTTDLRELPAVSRHRLKVNVEHIRVPSWLERGGIEL